PESGTLLCKRRRDREAEGAPLLREYGPKAHRGFESHRLRQELNKINDLIFI
ncbi:MAG: hypothetical protein RL357_2022, partial [Pseudomonadota bacterium]